METDDDNDDVVVLSDEEDDQKLEDMAHAGAAQGILEGQMESDIDDHEMKQKVCDIFNRIMDGPAMTPTQTKTKTPPRQQTKTETPTQTKTKTPPRQQTKTETPTQTKTKTPPRQQTKTETPTQTKTKTPPRQQTKTETPTQTKTKTPPRQQTKMATKTDMDTHKDRAPGKPKSKGSKSKAAVKRVGAEGLLEPLCYNDDQGARHYSCPYGCSEDSVSYTSIEGMREHIRRVHGMGDGGVLL